MNARPRRRDQARPQLTKGLGCAFLLEFAVLLGLVLVVAVGLPLLGGAPR